MLPYRSNEHNIVNQLCFNKRKGYRPNDREVDKATRQLNGRPVADLCFLSCLAGSVGRLASRVAAAGRGRRNRSPGLTCERSGARPDGNKGTEKEQGAKMSKRTIKQRKRASLIAQLVKNPLSCKESTCNVGDLGSIPGLGRSPGEGNGYPLQCSGLENSMDRGDWQATVQGVTKSQTRLSDFPFHFT